MATKRNHQRHGGVIAQAKRVAALLDEQGDWDMKRPQGWTPKEMFSTWRRQRG